MQKEEVRAPTQSSQITFHEGLNSLIVLAKFRKEFQDYDETMLDLIPHTNGMSSVFVLSS